MSLSVRIGKLKLQNPVMAASGTFGYAQEFKDFLDLSKLGAVVTKTITIKPRSGNPMPRTCETPAGMLNSIGLENPGIEKFIKEKLPALKGYKVPVIVSIASEADPQEFVYLAKKLDGIAQVSALELNISCPNLKKKTLISQDAQTTFNLVKLVRRHTKKTLITKLSPNVTDISEIALAAEDAGSDALALINTLQGMSIDVNSQKPKIAMVVAGLSGPAIRPVALRMVWQVYQKAKVPIIGMGGIIDTASSLEFILAGATAVSVGTANFVYPGICQDIICGMKQYLAKHKTKDIQDLIGKVKI